MPEVSVIIPNYNHARFLEKRLESIIQQSFQNFEIILLDDCSIDNSWEILQKYRHHPKVSQIIFNGENSGSTFMQWRKGINAAWGKYIWIAESDDYAEPVLLEKLVNQLEANPKAGIAFCQSWSVDENDTATGIWGYTHAPKLNHLFLNNFTEAGYDFIRTKMSALNAIPNASAVLFRKDIYLAATGEEETFRLAGDWLLWVKMLQVSDVAFVAMPMNYFRTHQNNVRKESQSSGVSLEETCRVISYIAKNIALPPEDFNRMLWNFLDLWEKHLMEYNIPLHTTNLVYRRMKEIDPYLKNRIMKKIKRNPLLMLKGTVTLISGRR
jgi:glycosyltransferase involved in cell wall biosynthesis